MKNTLVFTGSYTQSLRLGTGQIVKGEGDGICVFRIDKNGELNKLSSTSAPNPSYLALHPAKPWLYAVNELKECDGVASSSISAYKIDAKNDTLHFLNKQLTYGEDACNVSLSPDGNHLLIANYSGGSLCVLPIETNGHIGRPSCFFQHYGSSINPVRQDAPHVHQVITDPSGKQVLATDLGTDEIVFYDADWKRGHLRPRSRNISFMPGMGPRLCAFNKPGNRLYALAELGNAISVYGYDEKTVSANLMQTISTLPDGSAVDSIAACIKLHPNGKLLFASNRGHNSIAVYRIEERGFLALLYIQPTGGHTPRDFDISPSGELLVVGNQESNELATFSIDANNGTLTELHREFCGSVTAVIISSQLQPQTPYPPLFAR